jgi:hypothetical protein
MFRHGFERYNMMRLDPGLCFLAKCGPPDNAAVQVSGSPLSAAGLWIQILLIPDPASVLTSVPDTRETLPRFFPKYQRVYLFIWNHCIQQNNGSKCTTLLCTVDSLERTLNVQRKLLNRTFLH